MTTTMCEACEDEGPLQPRAARATLADASAIDASASDTSASDASTAAATTRRTLNPAQLEARAQDTRLREQMVEQLVRDGLSQQEAQDKVAGMPLYMLSPSTSQPAASSSGDMISPCASH